MELAEKEAEPEALATPVPVISGVPETDTESVMTGLLDAARDCVPAAL